MCKIRIAIFSIVLVIAFVVVAADFAVVIDNGCLNGWADKKFSFYVFGLVQNQFISFRCGAFCDFAGISVRLRPFRLFMTSTSDSYNKYRQQVLFNQTGVFSHKFEFNALIN